MPKGGTVYESLTHSLTHLSQDRSGPRKKHIRLSVCGNHIRFAREIRMLLRYSVLVKSSSMKYSALMSLLQLSFVVGGLICMSVCYANYTPSPSK